jgi:DNA-binding SARP family transcriptional activator
MALVLRLLGRFDLTKDPGDEPKVLGVRAQLLLARLALAKGKRLDRAVLGAMFWADRAEPQARASLRQALFSLRQSLKSSSGLLQSEGETVRLDPDGLDCDVIAFDQLALSSDLINLENALALYGGDLLEGTDLTLLDPDGYLQSERLRLRDLALKIASALSVIHVQGGNWDDAVRVARRGLVLDPFAEALNVKLVQALQALGRHREARDQDDAFRRLMARELGLSISPTALDAPALISHPVIGAVAAAPRQELLPHRDLRRLAIGAAVLLLGAGIAVWQFATPRLSVVGGPVETTPSTLPSANLQALDLFLRAESQRRTAANDTQLRAAMAVYQRATSLDPGFAEAHAGSALAAVTIAQRRAEPSIYRCRPRPAERPRKCPCPDCAFAFASSRRCRGYGANLGPKSSIVEPRRRRGTGQFCPSPVP